MGDTSHREAGLWAIDTLNPNAWNSAAEFLRLSSADFFLTQEVKKRAGDECDAAESTARTAGWSVSIAPCRITAKQACSAGVAVGARSHIGMSKPQTSLLNNPALGGRFTMRLIGSMARGGGTGGRPIATPMWASWPSATSTSSSTSGGC